MCQAPLRDFVPRAPSLSISRKELVAGGSTRSHPSPSCWATSTLGWNVAAICMVCSKKTLKRNRVWSLSLKHFSSRSSCNSLLRSSNYFRTRDEQSLNSVTQLRSCFGVGAVLLGAPPKCVESHRYGLPALRGVQSIKGRVLGGASIGDPVFSGFILGAPICLSSTGQTITPGMVASLEFKFLLECLGSTQDAWAMRWLQRALTSRCVDRRILGRLGKPPAAGWQLSARPWAGNDRRRLWGVFRPSPRRHSPLSLWLSVTRGVNSSTIQTLSRWPNNVTSNASCLWSWRAARLE